MGTVPASVLEGTSCPCRTIWASQRAPRRRKCRGIARSRTNCDAKNPTQGNVEKGDFVHGKEARVKPALKVLLSGNQNVQRGEIRKGGATKPRETGESTVSAVSRPHGMGRVLLLLLLLAVETILLISNAEGHLGGQHSEGRRCHWKQRGAGHDPQRARGGRGQWVGRPAQGFRYGI
jgi:hypothetical protein